MANPLIKQFKVCKALYSSIAVTSISIFLVSADILECSPLIIGGNEQTLF